MGFSRIDLDLDMGEFVAITGESGSGKSTLLNVISGLDTYEEGEMFVCGEDTTAYTTEDYERYRKTYIGNIFQDFNLINSYTVYQNIEVVMLLSGKKKKECRRRILDLLDLVGLTEYRKVKVSRLSGGQKQRVAIARALAKDAPIIVADEPTGNLDSTSAEIVWETLHKVSKDKLVVVVTHNYDQAEPYVTRKLTMHDGKIIEDKSFARRVEEKEESTVRSASGFGNKNHKPDMRVRMPRKMRMSSELRLGARNTFNIPAKFMLLFIVYFFVATAVLGQYATSRNSLHQGELMGYNDYFRNTSSDRMIVKRQDEKAFTQEDIDRISANSNIRNIVKNDLLIDSGVSFTLQDYYVEASIYPADMINEEEINYGGLPESDYDIVIKANTNNDIYYLAEEAGDSLIGETIDLKDIYGMESYKFDQPIRVCGIILDDSEVNEDDIYGYATVYASDAVSGELITSAMATMSKSTINYSGTKVSSEFDRMLYSSPRVPPGKAYIMEDQAYYYKDGKAEGKTVGVTTSNTFFKSSQTFTIDKILTTKNFSSLLGMSSEEADLYYESIFINERDFKNLYEKGPYQISAFMVNEADSDKTEAELRSAGYSVLLMKNALTDVTGGSEYIVKLMSNGRLIIGFIILFYIAYAVIRLIMRSRNSYYSTLRILGATKKNTDNILRVELIIMMALAYGTDLLFVYLVRHGIIKIDRLESILHYLTFKDYAALALVLLVMSVLIANRYSRKIFTKSAMKAFRGEA